MNICVVATAARESGALTIYLQFLNALKEEVRTNKYFIFIDGGMPTVQIQGVTYIKYNTRGWRRIAFDFYGLKRQIKKMNIVPDCIVSFQNTAVRYPKVRQIIYFHNLLPLTNRRWNPFKPAERSLFFYTSLYPQYIRCWLRKDTDIVVQAEFIKDLFIKRYNHPQERVFVLRPNAIVCKQSNNNALPEEYRDCHNFIYPAIPQIYKRHDLLIDTLRIVRREQPDLFAKIRIHLTFKASDYETLTVRLKQEDMEDQFVFHGKIPQEELFSYYQQCKALLFPSNLESCPLPLLEAASLGLPVAVTDAPYSHEALSGYEGVTYMNAKQDWLDFIIASCKEKKRFEPFIRAKKQDSWAVLLDLINATPYDSNEV